MSNSARVLLCLVRVCLPLVFAAGSGAVSPSVSDFQDAKPSPEALARIDRGVRFEDHSTADGKRFVARAPGYVAVFEPSGLTLGLADGGAPAVEPERAGAGLDSAIAERERNTPSFRWLREELVGVRPEARLGGRGETSARAHYFHGPDPSSWRTDLPVYREVWHRGVYEGIDVRSYDRDGRLERDFVVYPGGSVDSIALRYPGAKSVSISKEGALLVETAGGVVRQSAPVIYQEVGSERVSVEGRYTLSIIQDVGFEVGGYDAHLPLVIDPVLEYATYLGAPDQDAAFDVAVDALGNFYVTGETQTPPVTTFPMAMPPGNVNGGIAATAPGGHDAFVTKYSPAGDVVYSAILGGSKQDGGFAISVGTDGSAYIGGLTFSDDYPMVKEIQPYQGGGEGFVTVLSPTGQEITFSTYVGGNQFDLVSGLALDGQEDIIIVGRTSSDATTFEPTTPTFDDSYNGGEDGFLAEIRIHDPLRMPFYRFKTYLGSSENDRGNAVAVGANGDLYVVGYTEATAKFDHAPDPLIQTMPGGAGDAFILQVNEGGGGSRYFSFLGGSGRDSALGVALTATEEAVIGGDAGPEFPTSDGVFQPDYGGGSRDAFLAKINAEGNARIWSSYLGGSMFDQAGFSGAVAVTGEGDIVLVGGSDSANFPITADAIQPALGGFTDAFVAKVKADGSSLLSATFLGGTMFDRALGVAYQGGRIYVVGFTASQGAATGFPVTPDAAQLSAPNPLNGFVAVIREDGGASMTAHPADSNQDFRISGAEVSGYAAAFVQGNAWPKPPSPPDGAHVTSAALIFLQGAGSEYTDEGGAAPGRWVPRP